MKKMIAVATALAAGLAVADQAPAPAAAAPAVRDFYVTDFYAPPPDWIPKQAIRDYSLNTRVPDLFWLKYGDAYTLALRIRPLAEAQLEKDFEVGLIDRKRADDARAFRDDREKNADCRTVGVFGLAVQLDRVLRIRKLFTVPVKRELDLSAIRRTGRSVRILPGL